MSLRRDIRIVVFFSVAGRLTVTTVQLCHHRNTAASAGEFLRSPADLTKRRGVCAQMRLKMEAEDVVSALETYGPYQRRLFLLLTIPLVLRGFQAMMVIVTFYTPPHRSLTSCLSCREPDRNSERPYLPTYLPTYLLT